MAIENLSNMALKFKFKTETTADTFFTIRPGDVAWDNDNTKADWWSAFSLNLVGCENQNNVEVVIDLQDVGHMTETPHAHVWNFPEVGKSVNYCADWTNSVYWEKSNDRHFIIPGTHFDNNKYIGYACDKFC